MSMNKHCMRYIFLIYTFLSFNVVFADSWRDPEWKEMLDESDVVALVEYTNDGDFAAHARIITIYKGSLKKGAEICITGFSNIYGPVDPVKNGDRFIVFLRHDKFEQERLANKEQFADHNYGSDKERYLSAYKQNKGYDISTPTSGDLRIDKKAKKVQYDLLGTTYDRAQPYNDLAEFEAFLRAYFDKTKRNSFCEALLKRLQPVSEKEVIQQYFFMLDLLGYDKYVDIFAEYAKVENNIIIFALSKTLGNIATSGQARTLLIKFLDNENPLLQGEVVRQLAKHPKEIIAPIFVQKLKITHGLTYSATNIMDPVRNTFTGGRAAIIDVLVKWEHTPAIPELIALLEDKSPEGFLLIVNALRKLGSRGYIPHIAQKLEDKNIPEDEAHNIIEFITTHKLAECLPSAMQYIRTMNRKNCRICYFNISTYSGIGAFPKEDVLAFLLEDFKHFVAQKDSLSQHQQREWINNYMEVFTKYKAVEAKPLLYPIIYEWFGINPDFVTYPHLYKVKKNLEDSIKQVFSEVLDEKIYRLTGCLAFIQNTAEVGKGGKPKADIIIKVRLVEDLDFEQMDAIKQHAKKIEGAMNLEGDKLTLQVGNGSFFSSDDRLTSDFTFTLMPSFMQYLEATPTQKDLAFLESFWDYFPDKKNTYMKKMEKIIDKMKEDLKK